MYNEAIKKRYLETISETSYVAYESRLKALSNDEKRYNKDIYDFTRKEIIDTLYALELPSMSSARAYLSTVKSYIDWAIANGYVNSNINPVARVYTNVLDEIIDHTKKMFISEEELTEIEEKDLNNNYQDRVISRLIFEGVYGTKFSELAGIKLKDINTDTNEITIREGKFPRTVQVSERLVNFLLKAASEDMYILANGLAESRAKEKKLIQNDYVIRAVDNGRIKDHNAPVSYMTLYTKLRHIKEITNKPYLTPTNIRRSGMLYMGYLLYKENGKLDKEEYNLIAEKFGTGKIGVNRDINNIAGIKEFVTIDNIKSYYEI
ncbi:hypothetical protein PQ478_08830 [Alkalihalophilus pseudofirmus]|uniref:phage lytic cycle repressor MrpR family protein n=1 Tax=Alkalihalophilus pseudofirmus TaxID=79885 RepID=UPI00259B07FC|nr:hypothetical protein [Alkalihalophilus pseudofirmus]WEG18574.1 hypothetical protein PQ478_08830 [Alkalihalophilus pseudofirmus]